MSMTGELVFEQPSEDTLRLILSGRWKLEKDLPTADEVVRKLEGAPAVRHIGIDAQGLADWDTGLLIFLADLQKFCAEKKIRLKGKGLPEGVVNLLELAAAVPEKKDARKAEGRVTFLTHLGDQTVDFFRSCGDMLEFVGESTVAFLKLLRGKAQYRRSDLGLILESCSGQALPIVTLISFLVGMILAFIGAMQLHRMESHQQGTIP